MENINPILFYITALIIIFSSLMTITTKRIMYSVFYAFICFFFIGLIFFSLNAPFIGSIQISIYAIALSILFVIAIVLTNYKNEIKAENKIKPRYLLSIFAVIIISSSILISIKETAKYDSSFMLYINSPHLLTSIDNTKQLATELLMHNLYSFEILGIYILIALIGISTLLAFRGDK